jgi:hypothetical protein
MSSGAFHATETVPSILYDMADTLSLGPASPFVRRDSNLLSPPRSPRRPPISPRPSSSLLKLQKIGLELGPSRSDLSLHAPSYNSSFRTTPSDLDKPLPLEPPEIERRASSVYSVETTISNILDLYGGMHVDEHSRRESQVSNPHLSNAYRDTVAPLQARRYSGAESPPPLPLFFKGVSDDDSPRPIFDVPNNNFVLSPPIMPPPMPSPRIYQDLSPSMSTDPPEVPPLPASFNASSPSMYPESSPVSPADSKRDAPTFTEFTRNLPQKRQEVISPMSSAGSEDYHRQMAMDSLAPPSPQDSPDVHPISLEGSGMYLPGPMSGTITQVVAQDMVPPPLDLTSASRSSASRESSQKPPRRLPRNSYEAFLEESARKNSSIPSSLDIYNFSPIYNNSPIPPPAADRIEEIPPQQYIEEEKHRIVSFASEKYVGIQPPSRASHKTQPSKSSSISQRAGSIIRALSTRKGSAGSGRARKTSDATTPTAAEHAEAHEGPPPPAGGRKKLAIQPTSYQLYGEAAWERNKDSDKGKKKRSSKRSSKSSNRSSGDGEDYRMGLWEGAKHKLTRTASEKRREKLKNSIKLVGPTNITKEKHAREDPRRWWE